MPDYHLFQIRLSDRQVREMDSDPLLARAYLRARLGQVSGALEFGLHRFTAIVQAQDLDDLLDATTKIEGPWLLAPHVLHVEQGAKSTAVGDIAVDTSSGEAWLCSSFGWEALSWTRAEKFLVETAKRSPELQEEPEALI